MLREQLSVMGDYSGPTSQSTNYDEELVEAVKLFQFRHGLPTTGLVGSMTMAALSVPVEKRIEQIRASLERGRWILHDLEPNFLVVNIAAFKVYLVRDGEMEWETRAQVGKIYRKTPLFKSELRYMDVNPTWTVPRTILEQDMLPRIKQDPRYLQQKGLKVLDRNGDEVDPSTVDWSRYSTAAGFPYLLRQGPGPTNALGRIKFMFPNEYAIFLHDTPSRSLFAQSERAFSSGCVRVEDPFTLAELLMDDTENWPEERFLEIKDSDETKSVFLPKDKRMPVLTTYTSETRRSSWDWTASSPCGRDRRPRRPRRDDRHTSPDEHGGPIRKSYGGDHGDASGGGVGRTTRCRANISGHTRERRSRHESGASPGGRLPMAGHVRGR
jgi:murein L,D-transpeptidase YcbB/YkuD